MFSNKLFNGNKKYIIIFASICTFILAVLLIYNKTVKNDLVECSADNKEYILGGELVGIKLLASGVLVMGVDRDDNLIEVGDIILSANSQKIETDAALEEIVQKGDKIILKVQRNTDIFEVEITPSYNENSNKYRLGLWVKDSSAGIGTITFYEKDTNYFAALGHAITETSLNFVLPITTGGITKTEILNIKKGNPKNPGELKGTITNDTIGQIFLNTPNGIFGEITDNSFITDKSIIKIGKKDNIKLGKAYICATIDENGKKLYEVEIEKIYLNSQGNKNISIRITDNEVIEKTGGIIQGMSGAPLIQDNELIGAITHVFLDDPTRGYACFIENMIKDVSQI